MVNRKPGSGQVNISGDIIFSVVFLEPDSHLFYHHRVQPKEKK
jgi:hypothetical protein